MNSLRANAELLAVEGAPREPLLARTTRFALRFRRSVLVVWLVLLIAGGVASTRLSPLLSNTFGVPGTDSARAATITTLLMLGVPETRAIALVGDQP